jgi:hypothetical protein
MVEDESSKGISNLNASPHPYSKGDTFQNPTDVPNPIIMGLFHLK